MESNKYIDFVDMWNLIEATSTEFFYDRLAKIGLHRGQPKMLTSPFPSLDGIPVVNRLRNRKHPDGALRYLSRIARLTVDLWISSASAISRRTVAKYRMELGIGGAFQRKEG